MKKLLLPLLLLTFTARAQAPDPKAPKDLRGVLLEQLKTTHNKEDWFVPANIAVAGLTAEEAKWNDGKGNHSVGQLVHHIVFWDKDALARFKGEKPVPFNGNNDETFTEFDAKGWEDLVKQMDQVMTDWETAVAAADDATIAKWANTIAHVGAHNAYHIGQIIFVRKEQGNWDPSKGVK
jgi:uncharacterized damage-inducible protein DinB